MKLTIKANNRITNAKIKKYKGKIDAVEIDFDTSDFWSDLEMWLNNYNGDFLDYIAMNISSRNKIKTHK